MYVFGDNYNTPDGTCLRDYIHVSDLASGHVKAIECLNEEKSITTNLATGKCHSVLDVIKTTEEITGKHINYSIVGRRDGDPGKLYASSNNIINYKPIFSELETIIETMWNVYKK